MFRVLFLLLIVMSSVAFAQTEEKPKAVKFAEFETATNGYVKMKMDAFYVELSNNPNSQGYIINYGTDREIAAREKQIRDSILFRKYDVARITIVRGGFWKNIKTELWIVPPGACPPKPDSGAELVDNFKEMLDEELSMRIDMLYLSLGKDPNAQGYILNFGSAKTVAARDRRIRKYISARKYVPSRVTFKNGGMDETGRTEFWIIADDDKNKSKTQIWIVPPGAKLPGQ